MKTNIILFVLLIANVLSIFCFDQSNNGQNFNESIVRKKREDGIFENKVKAVAKQRYGKLVYVSSTFFTSVNQRYAIIINKVVWYAVRVVLEIVDDYSLVKDFKASEHITLKGAFEKKDKIINNLSNRKPPNFRDCEIVSRAYFIIIPTSVESGEYMRVPDKVHSRPDLYLRNGDVVMISRKLGFFRMYQHAGIYAGNEEIIHISPEDRHNPKSTSKVMQTSWSEFYGDAETDVFTWENDLKVKTKNEILNTAKSMLGQREGEYNFVLKNCQHFAAYCQSGREIFIPILDHFPYPNFNKDAN